MLGWGVSCGQREEQGPWQGLYQVGGPWTVWRGDVCSLRRLLWLVVGGPEVRVQDSTEEVPSYLGERFWRPEPWMVPVRRERSV